MRYIIGIILSCMVATLEAKTVVKISTLYPPSSEAVKSLQELGQTLNQLSEGEVELKVYPGGVMGNDRAVLRKIRIGQLHGALVSSSSLEQINEDFNSMFSQPFRYDSIEQVYEARSSYDPELRANLSEVGWYGFGPLDGGFSYLMSSVPSLTNLDELRNTKLWLPNTEDIRRMAKKMDVNFLVMGIGDVLLALDTGAVNTLVAPPAAVLTLNWISRFQYYIEAPVVYTFGMLVMPEKALKSLSDEHKQLVIEHLNQWAYQVDQELRASNVSAFSAMQELLKPLTFDERDVQTLRTQYEF